MLVPFPPEYIIYYYFVFAVCRGRLGCRRSVVAVGTSKGTHGGEFVNG